MSNICKTVSLRTRKIKDGRMLSYYLDYYPGYRDESTMKVIRHESLGIYIYAKPKNQTEQKYNLSLTANAEAIRCRRFEYIVNVTTFSASIYNVLNVLIFCMDKRKRHSGICYIYYL